MKKSITLFTAILSIFLVNRLQCQRGRKSVCNKTEKEKKSKLLTYRKKVTFDKVPENFATLSMGDMDIIHALGGKIVGRPDTKLTLPEELKKAQ